MSCTPRFSPPVFAVPLAVLLRTDGRAEGRMLFVWGLFRLSALARKREVAAQCQSSQKIGRDVTGL